MCDGVRGLQRGQDALFAAEPLKGFERGGIIDPGVFRAAPLTEPGVLRTDRGIVEPRGDRMRQLDVAVRVLQHVTSRSLQHAGAAPREPGRVIARYRKMFPFQPYEIGIRPGAEFVVFDVPAVGRFGLTICYDMWFPETTRQLAALGAEVILHPTMTDTIDRDVELPIARANATINQCYFFDINGIGDGGTGRSIIVGPSGHVLHEAGAGPEFIPVEIDLDRVRRERERGIRGLGQTLKTFRDRPVDFPVYQRSAPTEAYLQSLGPVEKQGRRTDAEATTAVPVVDPSNVVPQGPTHA